MPEVRCSWVDDGGEEQEIIATYREGEDKQAVVRAVLRAAAEHFATLGCRQREEESADAS